MNTTKIKMSDIRPVEKNVRRHPQKQLEELQRSYKMFGQYRPLVITSDNEILVGNGLYEALKGIDVEEVDAIKLPENVTNEYKQKLMLADNKIFSLGTDNVANIDDILSNIGDLEIPGFDEQTLNELYNVSKEMTEEIKAMPTMGIISDTKKQEIEKVSEYRKANPNEQVISTKKSEYEPEADVIKQIAPETAEQIKYVTCPHCGTKVYL